MHYYALGIDIREQTLHCVLLDPQRAVCARATFPNTPEGYEQLHAFCQPYTDAPLTCCALYLPLAYRLFHAGYTVYVVNPKAVHYYARALLRAHKTDAHDAEVIARYGANYGYAPHPWRPRPADLAQLRSLLRVREQLQEQLQRVANEARALQVQGLEACAQAWLTPVMETLTQQLQALEETLQRWEQSHPHGQQVLTLWRTVPGVGVLTAWVLLAETGGLERFEGGRALARYGGLIPMVRQSGQRTGEGGGLVPDANRRLRRALYLAALSAVRWGRAFRALYQRLQRSGKPKKVALCAVARHLVLVLYALWRDGVPYDEARHLRDLEART